MDLLKLRATLGLDSSEYMNGLRDAENEASVFGDVLKANLVTKGIDLAIAGFKKLTGASIGFVQQSVGAFGQFQQLVGGVETLFGESSEAVMENAKNAFKTAGMSANEYMDTVTSFSASLIQATGRGEQQDIDALKDALDVEIKETKRSLQEQYNAQRDYWNDRIKLVKGTAEKDALREQRDADLKVLKRANEEQLDALKAHKKIAVKEAEAANNASVTTAESLAKAAELADQAIIDMSDNANKMGTNMQSIQNAYQGFAKQNFTMLDNLKLGYGGTKEEMERLLQDAERIKAANGETVKYSITSYADMVEAIHVIQTEMGITGTTTKEAGETIQGSVGAVSAAWKNLVTGIADPNANLGKLIDNLVQSAKTALRNLIPTIRQALTGLATLIRDVAPVIAAELPGLINDVLPPLIEAATTLIVALVQNLPTILTVLFEALPKVMESIGSALMESWPAIQDALLGLLDTTAGKVLAIIGGVVVAVKGFKIVKGIGDIVTAIGNLAGGLPALSTGLTTATTASEGLAGSSTALSGVLGGLATAFLGVADALLVTYDVMALDEAARTYADANEAYLSEIDNAVSNYKKLYDEKGKEIADQWANMVYQIDTTNLSMEESQKAIAAKIETYWDGVPKNMWEGFQGGWNHYFGEGGSGLLALMGDAFTNAVDGICGLLGIDSPSKVFAEIGRYVDEGFAEGVVNNLDIVDDAVDDLADAMYNDNMYQEQELQTVSATVIGDRNSGGAVQATSAGTAQDITLVLELDGEALARKMFRYNKNESNRRGNSFVVA